MKQVLPLKKIVIVIVLGLIIWGARKFGLQDYLSLTYLRDNADILRSHVAEQPLLSSLIYFGAYVLVAALSLPGAAIMTLAG
ncbi:MAG: pyridine nucleotide-disulfide oxidoreductase, partial [Bdellovibrionota bacterium]